MVDIYLNPETGDIDLSSGLMRLTETIQENTHQRVIISLNVNKGEWGFNIDLGVPYFENENNPIQILGKTNKNIIDAYVRDAILSREGVIDLVSYRSHWNRQSGLFSIEFEATTDQGPIQITTDVNV